MTRSGTFALLLKGYAHTADSVFPPLYPLAIRGVGAILGGGPVANLIAAILISNLAFLALLTLFYQVVSKEIGEQFAPTALVYLTFFTTGYYFIAPYSESLFTLFALASIMGSATAQQFSLSWFSGLSGRAHPAYRLGVNHSPGL